MDSDDNGDDSAAGADKKRDPAKSSASSRKKPSAASSTAKSRAAQRKVRLEPSAATAAAKTPRKVTKPPLYRRGGFWFLVIVAEVLVALLISYRFERTPDSVDLTGANVDQFCADVAAIRGATAAQANIDISTAAATFTQQRDAYVKLKASAPPDLQPDLDRLIKSTDVVITAAQDLQQKKVDVPDYAGAVADLIAVQSAQDERLVVPNARLNLAVKNACNIDLAVPLPPTSTTTSVPTTTAAPGGTTTVVTTNPSSVATEPTPSTTDAPGVR